MVANGPVHASLHGIDKQPAFGCCRGYLCRKIDLCREGLLAFFVGDELHCPEQADAADIADCAQVAESLQSARQCVPRRACAC